MKSPNKHKKLFVVWTFLIILLIYSLLFLTSEIHGVVVDENERPVKNVLVRAEWVVRLMGVADSSLSRTGTSLAISNEKGEYVIHRTLMIKSPFSLHSNVNVYALNPYYCLDEKTMIESPFNIAVKGKIDFKLISMEKAVENGSLRNISGHVYKYRYFYALNRKANMLDVSDVKLMLERLYSKTKDGINRAMIKQLIQEINAIPE